MNIANVETLEIFGVTVAVGTLIWGIYVFRQQSKYPGSLTFILEPPVRLVDDFAQKLSNVNITYKNEPVKRGMMLLNGYLINNGSSDITDQMVEIPLECALPEGCDFLEVSVTATSENLKIDGIINENNRAEFSLGMFRKGESFSFQYLISIDKKLSDQIISEEDNILNWTHRIANVGKIEQTDIQLDTTQEPVWPIALWLAIGIFATIMSISALYKSNWSFFYEKIISAKFETTEIASGKKYTHIFQKNGEGTTNKQEVVSIKDEKTQQIIDIPISTYISDYKTKTVINKQQQFKWTTTIVLLIGLLFAGFNTNTLLQLRKYKKIIKPLKRE